MLGLLPSSPSPNDLPGGLPRGHVGLQRDDPNQRYFLNGTFNNWCGSCAPMSDANNDSVWEITVPLAADTFDYKFTINGWTAQETLVPGSACTFTAFGFTNRRIVVNGPLAYRLPATVPAIPAPVRPVPVEFDSGWI